MMEVVSTMELLRKYHKPRRKSFITTMNKIFILLMLQIYIFTIVSTAAVEDACPWSTDPRVSHTIKSQCQCARNPSSNNQLSIQCQEVEITQIISVLTFNREKVEPLELLYLNSSKVTDTNGQVPPRIFRDVKMVSLQMSGCGIKQLHPEALRGLENTLKHLSLTGNKLEEVPKSALEKLYILSLLDLSYNTIKTIPNAAFERLTKLTTLKLNDNNLQLETNAFSGLEASLKNLNLKGTRISKIPEAIRNLSSLAFLDLAQNRIRELDLIPFTNLHSLAALNLERNLLQTLPITVFTGVNDTLSSLSLLNNLITQFPRDALQYLHELRVLDLGFNLLTEIPNNAFDELNALTLLALDGNPLSTVPAKPFARLNGTLRGLSLGGKFLNCDCQVSWIVNWVQNFDLQVTSRERSPQFCGNPPELRLFNFYQLKYDDFQCERNKTTSTTTPKIPIDRFNSSSENFDLKSKSQSTQVRESSQALQEQDGRNDKINIKNGSKNRDQVTSIRDKIESSEGSFKPSEKFIDTDEAKGSDNVPLQLDIGLIERIENQSSTFRPFAKRVSLIPPESINFTTLNYTIKKSPQPIKSLPIQQANLPKLPAKSITTTTSTTSTVVSSSNGRYSNIQSTTIEPLDPIIMKKTINNVFQPGPEYDDSKIPIITGVGPRIISNHNTGSIVQVRVTPTSTTTTTTSKKFPKVRPTTDEPPQQHISDTSASSHHQQQLHPQTHNNVRLNNLIFAEKLDIEIDEIERTSDSVLVQWNSQKQNGFRIIYRIFGEDTFRHGPPLAPTEREYRIQNLPYNECIVVCVVPYEEIVYNEISTSASSVPPGSQCRELKPVSPSVLMNHMDKITIAASAAICIAVLSAVLIFIGVTRSAKKKRDSSPIITKIPPGSFPAPSPGALPINPSGSLTLTKDWDQLSAVSTRSIPRIRVYNGTMDGPPLGNGPPRGVIPPPHSHHHHYQIQYQNQRSVPDGHSTHRSYLSSHHAHHNHSVQSYKQQKPQSHMNSGITGYLNNQSRLLRASLGPRSSQDALNKQLGPSAHLHRHLEQNTQHKRRKGPRLSTCDSLNTLSGYDTPDNWTDHDLDVYVAQNATRRDLVQL